MAYDDELEMFLAQAQDPKEKQFAEALRNNRRQGDAFSLSTIPEIANFGSNVNERGATALARANEVSDQATDFDRDLYRDAEQFAQRAAETDIEYKRRLDDDLAELEATITEAQVKRDSLNSGVDFFGLFETEEEERAEQKLDLLLEAREKLVKRGATR
jgi:hypothetical protein|tara:strand:+ start:840 stop:1316 length:477 start_codon:yes stop_codon:yes gene_type:complete